jgi:hypothetical protein
MSRSGYIDYYDADDNFCFLWDSIVSRSINGKRGQRFLRELIEALDAMPKKELIADDLVTEEGECCAMGAVAIHRGIDVSGVDPEERDEVGALFDIAPTLAAEIASQNDNDFKSKMTPQERWHHMRKWAADRITEKAVIA